MNRSDRMDADGKGPAERGRETYEAVGGFLDAWLRDALGCLAGGCVIYALYCVVGFVVAVPLMVLADLPWWAWVGTALIVGYLVNRMRA